MSKLTVLSKQDGFRRSGIAFSSAKPTIIDTDTLSGEALKAIKEDPMLLVAEPSADGTEKTNAVASDTVKLMDDLSVARAENDQLKKEIKAAAKITAELTAKVESLEAEKTELAGKVTDLEKQVVDLTAKASSKKTK